MSGHRPFRELTKDWSPEQHERAQRRLEELLRELSRSMSDVHNEPPNEKED
jgi:hypothetical protein